MTCALCTRHRTDGTSRCAGCSESGYYTDTCKVYRCCREKSLNQCGECADFPCERLQRMGEFSNLKTDNVKRRVCDAVARDGFIKWYAEYKKRADMLTDALERYNDGRMKRYLCELFIRNDMDFLCGVMERAKALTGDRKELGKAFLALVEAMSSEAADKSDNAPSM